MRRSRLDLEEIPEYKEDLKRQGYKPVLPEPPEELEYPLADIADLYISTLNRISPSEDSGINFSYQGARYKPTQYIVDDAKLRKELDAILEEELGTNLGMLLGRQVNVSLFMRRMLVRRFESSVAAFRDSLNSMINSSEHILNWIEKRNKVPIYKKGQLPDVEYFYTTTNDDIEEEIVENFEKYQERGFFEIDLKYIKKDEFLQAISDDLNLLKDIRSKWFSSTDDKKYEIQFDPKLSAFSTLLKKQLADDPKRKIIVFTEFADTANYLGAVLETEGLKVFKYTSKEASPANKAIIRANFDAGLKSQFQKDDYKVLVATDAISEGYNLHRAGTIFNYDIPYNPTRIIQRIGRINRINKKMFEKLYIYNYFPTDIGEKDTRTKQISTLKMMMIHAIMGEDTKALTKDEELNAFFKERYQAELAKSEERSWDTKYRNLLNQLKGSDIYLQALQIPHRARTGREVEKPYKGVLLFGKKGNDFVFKIGDNTENEPMMLTSEQALHLFEAVETEEAIAVDKHFDKLYQHVKMHLYRSIAKDENEKSRLEAVDKLKLWGKTKVLPKDYLTDLLLIIQNDGLTGEEIRFINKQTSKTADKIVERITQDYLNRIVAKMNKVEEGDETLILAEQLK